MKKVIPVLLFALTIASCHHSHPPVVVPNNPINQSDYPINTGNTWTYQVFDSIHNITEIAVFKIISKTVINTDSAIFNFQTTISGAAVDSGTITQTTTAYTYSSTTSNTLFESLRLAFPLNATSHWQGHVPGDTLMVVNSFSTYQVLGHSYSNVFQVHRSLIFPDYYVQQTVYIATGVGVIQETLDVEPWIDQYKIVRLMSYSVH